MFKVKRSFFVLIYVTPNYLNYIARESEKICLGEHIFAKQEKFFDHALRLVNDFSTLKSSF